MLRTTGAYGPARKKDAHYCYWLLCVIPTVRSGSKCTRYPANPHNARFSQNSMHRDRRPLNPDTRKIFASSVQKRQAATTAAMGITDRITDPDAPP